MKVSTAYQTTNRDVLGCAFTSFLRMRLRMQFLMSLWSRTLSEKNIFLPQHFYFFSNNNATKFQLHFAVFFAHATLLKPILGIQCILNVITVTFSADADAVMDA